MNYVFYVSDMDCMPASGRVRKMEGSRDIAAHLSNGISKCIVKKYTEYDGSIIDGDSVGIVFPVHSWGVSLAVISFIPNLRISERTYIYAVSVGDCLSADVDATASKRIKYLDPIEKQLHRKAHGTNYDLFFRCVDFERKISDTEINNRGVKDVVSNINNILQGLLFTNMDEWQLKCENHIAGKKEKEQKLMSVIAFDGDICEERTSVLSNVYLDEYWIRGVRLCQGM